MKTIFIAINSQYIHTNIAVRQLNQCCIAKNYDSEFMEFNINLDMTGVLSEIINKSPDIIGFSCYIWNIEYILKLCEDIKLIKPDTIIILGGPEVSFNAQDILSKYTYIDYIACGEGEEMMPELIGYIEDINKGKTDKIIPDGVYYRNKNKIIGRGYRIIENLAQLPFPYSDDELNNPNGRIFYYEASRGCPFSCSYCLSSAVKGVREIPIDMVEKQLDKFIHANVPLVKFVDRTFNCNRKRAIQIIQYISKAQCDTCFHFEIGADLLDDDIINLLNSVPKGRIQFEAGIQSANDEVLEKVCRKTNIEKLLNNVKRVMDSGRMHIHLDLIAGLPGEDMQSFAMSYNTVMTVRPHNLQLGFLKLLYGSSLRNQADKLGLIYRNYAPYEILQSNEITAKDLLWLKQMENIHQIYYNSGKFIFSYGYLLDRADEISFSNRFKNAFGLLDELTIFISNVSVNKVLSYKDRFDLLYKFAQKYLDIKQLYIFKVLLRCDYLSNPAKGNPPEEIKSFADINEISEKVRELKRQAVITSSQARRAKFDIFPMNPLTLEDNKTLIMFDSDKKDKLTGRAEMNIYSGFCDIM